MIRARHLLVSLLLVSSCASAQEGPVSTQGIQTAAEASGFTHTSRWAEVQTFLDSLEELPHASRLEQRVLGSSHEGRELPLVVVSKSPTDLGERSERLRVVCIGNIHAGEVEGKEAIQALCREFAMGEHAALLEHMEIWFVPIYNADGNERVNERNRESQNGPVEGVGIRPNAQGFDLNRDFLKAEAPETRALLSLWNQLDPHVFIDLHTTNGSYHGYHLTYSPSLSTNADPGLNRFAREVLLPEVTQVLEETQGLRTYHYGNFSRRGEASWSTYDHRPRFGTNAFGLRGRLAVLSEAYSYLPFEERVVATRGFVLQLFESLATHREELQAACAHADKLATEGKLSFGHDSSLIPGVQETIAVGGVNEIQLGEGRGVRREVTDELSYDPMLVRSEFASGTWEPLPEAWAVVGDQAAIGRLLRLQGITYEVLEEARAATSQRFQISELTRAKRPFQGHRTASVTGHWSPGPELLPVGTLLVPARQPRARLAAQLLEPQSEDSALTWNVFPASLGLGPGGIDGSGAELSYPILRVAE
ncbi:MAG: hypothetical protein ACI8QC_001694 [Planctomycetota bacterium]|jgi:hypothetical protein